MPVKPGDMVLLPAGTVHAIGAGVLLAEVQQSSDTTYRLHDWNRVGLNGKPRQLHLNEALESIGFGGTKTQGAERPVSSRSRVTCEFFEMEALLLEKGESRCLEGEGPLVLMGVGGDGNAKVAAGEEGSALSLGKTLLVPAQSARSVRIESFGRSSILTARIRV
jgi:mannose-6-phosphate isomerase